MKKLVALLVVLVLLFAVVACGNGNTSSPSPSNSGTSDAGAPAASPSDAGSSGTEHSRIVSVGSLGKAGQMDPARVSMNISDVLYNQMNLEALVTSDHSGRGYDPMLATSWEHNADATVWTFKLREGVTFHNDAPFDADDVVCTFQYILDLGDESAAKITNIPTFIGIKKIDQFTVELTFSEPFPLALSGLQSINIFSNEAFEELGPDVMFLWEHCYGTGAWILNEWIDGEYTSYIKNENYWDKANYDSYYNEVRLYHIGEPSSLVAAHLAGDIQVYCPASGMNTDLLGLYDGVLDRVNLVKVDTGSVDYLTIQCGEGYLGSDENFRKALSYAIDRDLIYETLHSGNGRGAVGFFHPQTATHDPNNTDYRYDPELAKQYLEQSSYDGRTLAFMNRGPVTRLENMAVAISDMFAAIGIKSEVFTADAMTYTTRVAESDYDLLMSSAPVSDGMPTNNYKFIRADSEHTNFYDQRMIDLINAYLEELDDATRIDLGRQVGNRITEIYAPWIAIGSPVSIYAVDKGVIGYDFYPDGVTGVSRIDFDPSLAP